MLNIWTFDSSDGSDYDGTINTVRYNGIICPSAPYKQYTLHVSIAFLNSAHHHTGCTLKPGRCSRTPPVLEWHTEWMTKLKSLSVGWCSTACSWHPFYCCCFDFANAPQTNWIHQNIFIYYLYSLVMLHTWPCCYCSWNANRRKQFMFHFVTLSHHTTRTFQSLRHSFIPGKILNIRTTGREGFLLSRGGTKSLFSRKLVPTAFAIKSNVDFKVYEMHLNAP